MRIVRVMTLMWVKSAGCSRQEVRMSRVTLLTQSLQFVQVFQFHRAPAKFQQAFDFHFL